MLFRSVGRSINGGNGIVLDGSKHMDEVIKSALSWDVMGGVARRGWARNENAIKTSAEWNIKHEGEGHITIPYLADDKLIDKLVDKK